MSTALNVLAHSYFSDAVNLDSAQGVLFQQVHDGFRSVVELKAEATVNHQTGVEAARLDGDSSCLPGSSNFQF